MEDNILGCFISSTIGDENGKLFGQYIFDENGIAEQLKKLKYYNYGKNIKLILFQFYVNPVPYLLQNIKEIEDYRISEKSIGVPIIIKTDVFFNKTKTQRIDFLRASIIDKLKVLEKVVETNRLDTNIQLLIQDFKKI